MVIVDLGVPNGVSGDPALPEATARYLAEVAAELYAQNGVVATMETAVRHAVEAVAGSAASGALSTSRDFRRDVAVSTTEGAERVDSLQFDWAEGPCLTAVHERRGVLVEDISGDLQWPRWAALANEIGFQSMLAVPLAIEPHPAVMSVYWDSRGRPGRHEASLMALLARHAAVAVADARRASTLREAVQARHRVGLAQGILMERLGLDDEQSFGVLRRYSRDNNIKLSEIAQEIIATRSLPGA